MRAGSPVRPQWKTEPKPSHVKVSGKKGEKGTVDSIGLHSSF